MLGAGKSTQGVPARGCQCFPSSKSLIWFGFTPKIWIAGVPEVCAHVCLLGMTMLWLREELECLRCLHRAALGSFMETHGLI